MVAKRMLEVGESTRAQVVAFNSLVVTGQETIHGSGLDAAGAGYEGSHQASALFCVIEPPTAHTCLPPCRRSRVTATDPAGGGWRPSLFYWSPLRAVADRGD
jgi:hypothetical protein